MIYTLLTKNALNYAYEKHACQKDRLGIPYIFHPYHVAEQMQDEITTAIALLHDVIEDTDATKEELLSQGFPTEVVEAVAVLTKAPNEEYKDYIRRVRENPLAVKVKLADLEHNTDRSRILEPSEKDIQRYERYEWAKKFLTEKTN